MSYLADEKNSAIKSLTITIPITALNDNAYGVVTDVLKNHKGDTELYFRIKDEDGRTSVMLKSKKYGVEVCREVLEALKSCDGVEYEI